MNRDVEVHGLHPLSAGNDVHIVRRIYQSNVGIIEKILELFLLFLVPWVGWIGCPGEIHDVFACETEKTS